MRIFVVIGQKATASPDFLLADVPGTSGRLDVLLRCMRAALLYSHGLRRDTRVYLVLLGGPIAPRVLRVDGKAIRFVRPDERNLASLVKKALARNSDNPGFNEIRPGLAIASGGLDVVLQDFAKMTPFVLEEGAIDVRDAPLDARDTLFFVGDHLGFDNATRAMIRAYAATPLSVGPVSVHADDAIAIVSNELDRREVRNARVAGT
jgi:tRNA (pseudouridine54-N1)-methyltransferase